MHGAAVAFNRKSILRFAGNLPLRGDILCRDTHVHGVEWIGQCAHHHIDIAAVPHALAPAQ